MSWEIREGDCLKVLQGLDTGSVQTCVTSPPYWGLRDYGTATWKGGDPDCSHRVGGQVQDPKAPGAIVAGVRPGVDASTCLDCGATRTDSQLGLEPTPEQYAENLVNVFREVRRVLRDDGTLWLNLGDSYATGAGKVGDHPGGGAQGENWKGTTTQPNRMPIPGLKPKDLCGIPWRVAFALQADGWWLRSDIIWSKPNPMPESVTDRPTRAHEYIFLFSKSARYFYDSQAIAETSTYGPGCGWDDAGHEIAIKTADVANPAFRAIKPTRNRRSVWEITTQPYPEAHFATFPPKLVEPCILAGSPPKCCGRCGKPWERVVKRKKAKLVADERVRNVGGRNDGYTQLPAGGVVGGETRTLGWRTTCPHDDPKRSLQISDLDPVPSTVLDPFCGSGTTGLVATQHGRDFIGIELNPEYVEMAKERIRRYEANPAGALEGDPEPIEGQIGLL